MGTSFEESPPGSSALTAPSSALTVPAIIMMAAMVSMVYTYKHSNGCSQRKRRRDVANDISLSPSSDSESDADLQFNARKSTIDPWMRGESPFDAEYSTDDEEKAVTCPMKSARTQTPRTLETPQITRTLEVQTTRTHLGNVTRAPHVHAERTDYKPSHLMRHIELSPLVASSKDDDFDQQESNLPEFEDEDDLPDLEPHIYEPKLDPKLDPKLHLKLDPKLDPKLKPVVSLCDVIVNKKCSYQKRKSLSLRRDKVIVIADDSANESDSSLGSGVSSETRGSSVTRDSSVTRGDSSSMVSERSDDAPTVEVRPLREIKIRKARLLANHATYTQRRSKTIRQTHHCTTANKTPKPIVIPPEDQKMVKPIPSLLADLIDSGIGDSDVCVHILSERTNEAVTQHRSPAPSTYCGLLNTLRRSTTSKEQCDLLCGSLHRTLSLHPLVGRVPFRCIDLITCVKRIQEAFKKSFCCTYNDYCLLQFYVNALQSELFQHSMASLRQIQSSKIFQWFVSRESYCSYRVKVILCCMTECITSPSANPAAPSTPSPSSQSAESFSQQEDDHHICNSVLLVFQQLLSLIVSTSRHPAQLAKTLAENIVLDYKGLKTFAQRWLLLSLLCPLVKLNVSKLVLECYFEGTCYLKHNYTMVDIVSAFFYAMPSENNNALQEIESLMPKTCVISEEKQFSADDASTSMDDTLETTLDTSAWDEMLMLIVAVVQSYVCVKTEKLRRCMRDRPCTSNSYQTECDYSTSDVPTPQDVSALRDHIVRHQKLSPRAHGYLAELECYSDLGG